MNNKENEEEEYDNSVYAFRKRDFHYCEHNLHWKPEEVCHKSALPECRRCRHGAQHVKLTLRRGAITHVEEQQQPEFSNRTTLCERELRRERVRHLRESLSRREIPKPRNIVAETREEITLIRRRPHLA